MEDNRTRIIIAVVVAFLIGWAIGLFLFGWSLTPVNYTGAGPEHLYEADQETYLVALADLYSFDNNTTRVQTALGSWEDAETVICDLVNQNPDQAEARRLEALAQVLSPTACTGFAATEPVEEEGGGLDIGYIVLICGLVLLLALIIGAIALLWSRRRAAEEGMAGEFGEAGFGEMRSGVATESDQRITPLARFQTTFVHGHDTYDDSFSIENASGDFLGECGVGISETIGSDMPKNVTAFEVWLFDKNDIRTVTKVVMSDHAFFDEAIKAKLAPKGEPVLARPNETIVLETASLIVNAEIADMEYGVSTQPPQGSFERFVVELSAWAKEGALGEANRSGYEDELLDF